MPRDVVVKIHFLLLVLGAHRVVHRAHGFAFAEDLERHALPYVALGAAVGKQTRFTAHHVREAGRNYLTVDVQIRATARLPKITYSCDGVTGDRHASGTHA